MKVYERKVRQRRLCRLVFFCLGFNKKHEVFNGGLKIMEKIRKKKRGDERKNP